MKQSNYAETSLLAGEDDEEGSKKGRARQTISDKRNLNILGSSAAAKKKKSTMSVRTALLYRKNLATLIEESVRNAISCSSFGNLLTFLLLVQNIACLPPSVPTYLTALTPPSVYPPRMLCSVCGYWGAYKCRRCAMPYCDRNCEAVHAETRCEKRVV